MRNACWGYLCQSGAMELKEVLNKDNHAVAACEFWVAIPFCLLLTWDNV